jgi:hypothetical protein
VSDEALSSLTAAGIAATIADSFGPFTVDVPAEAWVAAHEVLRDEVGLTFFDFLTASDELNDGFRVVTHLADFWGGSHVEHLMVRTLIPRATPQLASLSDVYAGANWHERETAESPPYAAAGRARPRILGSARGRHPRSRPVGSRAGGLHPSPPPPSHRRTPSPLSHAAHPGRRQYVAHSTCGGTRRP